MGGAETHTIITAKVPSQAMHGNRTRRLWLCCSWSVKVEVRCVTSHIPAGNYSGLLRRTWPPGDGVRGCTWVSHRSNFTLAIPVYPRHANWQEVACRSRWPEGVLTLTHAAQRLDSLYNAGQVADVQPLLLGIHEARGADLEHLRSDSAGNAWWRIREVRLLSQASVKLVLEC